MPHWALCLVYICSGQKDFQKKELASVAQLDRRPTGDQVVGSIPAGFGSNEHFFVEIDYEIFLMVILSLPLIQEGQLSLSGKTMSTSTG